MSEAILLQTVLENVAARRLGGPSAADVSVAGVTADSREAAAGMLFVAVRGGHHDGHDFVAAAAAQGCVALLVEQGREAQLEDLPADVAVYAVADSAAALAEVAAAFYRHPSRSLRCIGVTGTNGKTTVSYLLEAILGDQGLQVGVIGTVNYRYRDGRGERVVLDAPFTTPQPLVLQRVLRQMVDAGVTTVVMEVSSHALVQKRLGTIAFDVAVFTNLSHDHLDYHPSMEEYFLAKALLFQTALKNGGKAVITFKDSDEAEENRWPGALAELLEENGIEPVCCGRHRKSLITPLAMRVEADRTELELDTPAGRLTLVSPLVGRFNADNIITALTVTAVLGLDLPRAVATLGSCSGAPGRLERIRLHPEVPAKRVAFVDYAHTPDALLNVLSTLKGVPHGRLICVFGCGGDRDRAKRPEMGRIAARLADIAVVTDDNPRSETSAAIIEDILAGMAESVLPRRPASWLARLEEGRGCVVIPNREEAIRLAVTSARQDDIILVAGKGHEKYQLTSSGRRFFDDSLEVREALCSWSAETLAEALGAAPEPAATDRYFHGIATDSRSVGEGQVFVALRGETFDGHAYLREAMERGAAAVVVERQCSVPKESRESGVVVFRVDDTLAALGNLAGYRRRLLAGLSRPLVVGITGSTGKTTVKEMTAAIFARQWPDIPSEPLGRVLKTQGNFNNLIGLPLSLLPLELKHKAVVLEMGMNQPGEIERLAAIADPDISCIVNIHGAHLQGLGSIEGVAREKLQLFEGTGAAGTLVVNLDDPHIRRWAESDGREKISWSLSGAADVTASEQVCADDGCAVFTITVAGASRRLKLGVPGGHNVGNSLAAAAIAHAAGIGIEVIVAGLAAFTASANRLQVVRAKGGYGILDDTYNANPASMVAGLAALAGMPGGSKIAILGDMLELGASSAEAHYEVGLAAAGHDLANLLLVGDFAEHIARGAAAGGMARDKIVVFSSKDAISGWMENLQREGLLREDAWLLVKASRGLRLETVVARLTADN